MITRLHIRNFQSVSEAELALGRVTVIVGPSNSGKSAILRALRVLLQNAKAPGFVTAGAKTSVIEADLEDTTVQIHRGAGVSEYQLLTPSAELPEKFTKCGTTVPEAVTAVTRLPDLGVDLTFTTQFDKPFLLAESSTVVANVLGTLTNADILYAAQREAGRRHLQENQRLKVRREDLTSAVTTLKTDIRFTGLADAAERIAAAEAVVTDLAREGQLLRDVEQWLSDLSYADAALDSARSTLDTVRVLPDNAAPTLRQHAENLTSLGSLIAELSRLDHTQAEAEQARDRADLELADLEHASANLLASAGTCPTCGQSTKELAHATH